MNESLRTVRIDLMLTQAYLDEEGFDFHDQQLLACVQVLE